jgi:hypothetical protein
MILYGPWSNLAAFTRTPWYSFYFYLPDLRESGRKGRVNRCGKACCVGTLFYSSKHPWRLLAQRLELLEKYLIFFHSKFH